MTGYGAARFENEQVAIAVEIKTLNSKFLDASFRLPKSLSDKEQEIRTLLSENLERGKINLIVELARLGSPGSTVHVNEVLFKQYFDMLQNLADSASANKAELFKIALNFPDVISTTQPSDVAEEDWKLIKPILLEAIQKCNAYRKQEGNLLDIKLKEYAGNIQKYADEVALIEPQRKENIRTRLTLAIEELSNKADADPNRLEQELIYYIEKLDISEEQVRLKSNLDYFIETINLEESNGKKLNFIAQEIGREVNTMGSKAYHAQIQRLVVGMKDELEKIKEQVLNII